MVWARTAIWNVCMRFGSWKWSWSHHTLKVRVGHKVLPLFIHWSTGWPSWCKAALGLHLLYSLWTSSCSFSESWPGVCAAPWWRVLASMKLKLRWWETDMGCSWSSCISDCSCGLLFVSICYSYLFLAVLHFMSYLPSIPGLPTYSNFRIDPSPPHQMRGNSSAQTSSLAPTITQGRSQYKICIVLCYSLRFCFPNWTLTKIPPTPN